MIARYIFSMLGLIAGVSSAAEPPPVPGDADRETILRSPAIRTIPVARTFRFEPQTDITTDELARLEPYLSGKPLYDEDQKALGTAMRHLREVR
jgi:hypothetical protein